MSSVVSFNTMGSAAHSLPMNMTEPKHTRVKSAQITRLHSTNAARKLMSEPQPHKTSKTQGSVTEIVTRSNDQLSDMPMLKPMLAQLSLEERWLIWIAPPKGLPKTQLEDAGIDPSKVILLYPDQHNNSLQLAVKALRAGTCHAVVSCHKSLTEVELKRLEFAALQGGSQGILIRQRHTH